MMLVKNNSFHEQLFDSVCVFPFICLRDIYWPGFGCYKETFVYPCFSCKLHTRKDQGLSYLCWHRWWSWHTFLWGSPCPRRATAGSSRRIQTQEWEWLRERSIGNIYWTQKVTVLPEHIPKCHLYTEKFTSICVPEHHKTLCSTTPRNTTMN